MENESDNTLTKQDEKTIDVLMKFFNKIEITPSLNTHENDTIIKWLKSMHIKLILPEFLIKHLKKLLYMVYFDGHVLMNGLSAILKIMGDESFKIMIDEYLDPRDFTIILNCSKPESKLNEFFINNYADKINDMFRKNYMIVFQDIHNRIYKEKKNKLFNINEKLSLEVNTLFINSYYMIDELSSENKNSPIFIKYLDDNKDEIIKFIYKFKIETGITLKLMKYYLHKIEEIKDESELDLFNVIGNIYKLDKYNYLKLLYLNKDNTVTELNKLRITKPNVFNYIDILDIIKKNIELVDEIMCEYIPATNCIRYVESIHFYEICKYLNSLGISLKESTCEIILDSRLFETYISTINATPAPRGVGMVVKANIDLVFKNSNDYIFISSFINKFIISHIKIEFLGKDIYDETYNYAMKERKKINYKILNYMKIIHPLIIYDIISYSHPDFRYDFPLTQYLISTKYVSYIHGIACYDKNIISNEKISKIKIDIDSFNNSYGSVKNYITKKKYSTLHNIKIYNENKNNKSNMYNNLISIIKYSSMDDKLRDRLLKLYVMDVDELVKNIEVFDEATALVLLINNKEELYNYSLRVNKLLMDYERKNFIEIY
jgi:hypothetical protein